MRTYSIQWINKWLLSSCLLFMFTTQAQQVTPNRSLQGYQNSSYPNGQAVFVQPPYGSSVYTEYNYNSVPRNSNRLPSFTTNQAVFVQQPYGVTPQLRVDPYPTTNRNSLPTSASRYATPVDFPSTMSPAYPLASDPTGTSPYPTTVQFPSPTPNQPSPTFTRTDTYPYTSIQPSPQIPVSRQYNNYNPYGTTAKYPATAYPTVISPGNTNYQQSYPTGTNAVYPNNYPSNYPTVNYPQNAYPTSYPNNGYPNTTIQSSYPIN